MSPDREPQRSDDASGIVAPVVASREDDLLNAWDRLLAIASLYAARNTRFGDAVAEWREALRPVASADGTVCIEVGREDRLAHEGHVQPPERVAQCRLYPLLTGIGVEHIVLSLDIDAEALHRLLAILRETRRVAERSIGFQRAELPELPAGVMVQLRSFGDPGDANLGSVHGGEGAATTAESDALAGEGDAPAGESDATAGEGGAPSGDPGPGGERPDVRNPHVGMQSELARSLEDRLTAQAASLYRSLTQGAVPERLPEAAASEPAVDAEETARDAEPAAAFDAHGLRVQLAWMDDGAGFDAELLVPSQPEWFAFLLQLALADGAGATALRARLELAKALELDLGLHEIQTLVTACEGLLRAGDVERVDALLPLLLEPLARRGQRLEPVLVALAEGADARRRELLWPHLADALLREAAAPSLAQVTGADGGTALALPVAARARVLARLEARPALRTGRISAAIFPPLRAEMRPLLLMLLQSSRSGLAARQLRAALRESPPPAPLAGLLALLGDFKPRQREFYRLLLCADEEEGGNLALGREAASLALQILQRLPRSERRRAEVGDALLALAAAPPGEVDALLAAVLAERWLLFLPAWPAAARRQARRVQLRRQAGRSPLAKDEELRA